MTTLPTPPDTEVRYTVAVRALSEFTARAGDIDIRFGLSPSAQEGTAGHGFVTGNRPAGYEREVFVQGEHAGLQVRGRADGFDPDAGVLEEIKTFRGDLNRLPSSQRAVHWAQARIYAALLCQARALGSLTIRLVYFDIDTRQETHFDENQTASDLQAFFVDQCTRFMAWARQETAHRQARDRGLAALAWPQPEFRPGQRELAVAVYRSARDGGLLCAEAPTGIGKTLGTLFPMLRAMPVRPLDKVAFLTARTPGRALALDGLRKLGCDAPERPLRVLELVARDTACEHPGAACTGAACPLARGFYDRLPQARAAAADAGWLDRQALREIAAAHAVCPYYLGQEMLRWSDVVVADYNHLFDTRAAIFGLSQANGWALGVLVDEAHNLVDRVRGMYSATLDRQAVHEARREAPGLTRAWRRLGSAWTALAAAHPGTQATTDTLDDDFVRALQHVTPILAEHLMTPAGASATATQQLYFDILQFLRLAERFGSHSLFEISATPRPAGTRTTSMTAGIRNIVPAPHLVSRWAGLAATALFSATFNPPRYYQDLLGLPAHSTWIDVPAPFHAAQLDVRIARRVSTRYADRSQSLQPIGELMARQVAAQPGNYLAFFSSFAYLEAAFAHLASHHPEVPAWRQTPAMREADRDAFLARFQVGGQGIGFAVLGGIFGEGVDLPGERLIGAFIATLGLPQVNPTNEAIKRQLQHLFGAARGHDYAYLYPGLRKVVQAAGRVIRTPSDKGVLHLMDDRFGRPAVSALLPAWWRQNVVQSSSSTVVVARDSAFVGDGDVAAPEAAA